MDKDTPSIGGVFVFEDMHFTLDDDFGDLIKKTIFTTYLLDH